MPRAAATVLALVGAPPGEELQALAVALGHAANVRAVVPDVGAAPLERATSAWAEAVRAHMPYVLHDADPLADVVEAWVDRWEGRGDVGRLEVTVQAVLQRWRAGTVQLPDYYLVVDAVALAATARHWFLGVLAGVATHRVAVTGREPAEVVAAVRGLGAGRWWPSLDELLADVDRRVPGSCPLGEPAPGVVV